MPEQQTMLADEVEEVEEDQEMSDACGTGDPYEMEHNCHSFSPNRG
jgi:hypothetical protein